MSTQVFVIPVTEEPGIDMYWHDWAVISVEAEGKWTDKEIEKVEKVISSVNLSGFDDEDCDYYNVHEYLEAVETKLLDAGYSVEFQRAAKLAFPGE